MNQRIDRQATLESQTRPRRGLVPALGAATVVAAIAIFAGPRPQPRPQEFSVVTPECEVVSTSHEVQPKQGWSHVINNLVELDQIVEQDRVRSVEASQERFGMLQVDTEVTQAVLCETVLDNYRELQQAQVVDLRQ